MFEKLKEIREDRDYKEKEIADILGVAKNTYCNYEKENRRISYESIIKLAQFYNVSVDYLLGLTDVMKPYPRKEKK
ncbi:MAG: helix-turn-helix transcriptional regulator [Clostridia bacterium]|nr:helix-turn-helix transcriptional regulator [Clostridia bacterium]